MSYGVQEDGSFERKHVDTIRQDLKRIFKNELATVDITSSQFIDIIDAAVAAGVGVGILLTEELEDTLTLDDVAAVQTDIVPVGVAYSERYDPHPNRGVDAILLERGPLEPRSLRHSESGA